MIKNLLILLLGFVFLFQSVSIAHQLRKPETAVAPSASVDDVYQDDNVLYQNDQLTISNIYPNPAVSFISFKYNLHNTGLKAKIIIRNILGSAVGEYTLDPHNQQLKIEIEPLVSGMYFYTLSIDDKNVVTKKFLVKK